MGVFNSWDYSTKEAETDAERRAALVKEFLDSDVDRVFLIDEINGENEKETHAKSKN